MITNKIIKELEKGNIIWKKQWSSNPPRNLVNKIPYSGINLFLLSLVIQEKGFSNPYFLTFKQAQSLGGQVKKGEKGFPVIFWKLLEVSRKKEVDQNDNEPDTIPFLRYYTVFNVDQIDGIEAPEPEKKIDPIEAAEEIVKNFKSKPEIIFGSARAYYAPETDRIRMPARNQFTTPSAYYSTIFHELTHSTGHESRIKRFANSEGLAPFGSEVYSKEELVAELGSAFLCADSGISNQEVENQAAYIKNWLQVLKNDNKFIIRAASQAQKAAKFIKEN